MPGAAEPSGHPAVRGVMEHGRHGFPRGSITVAARPAPGQPCPAPAGSTRPSRPRSLPAPAAGAGERGRRRIRPAPPGYTAPFHRPPALRGCRRAAEGRPGGQPEGQPEGRPGGQPDSAGVGAGPPARPCPGDGGGAGERSARRADRRRAGRCGQVRGTRVGGFGHRSPAPGGSGPRGWVPLLPGGPEGVGRSPPCPRCPRVPSVSAGSPRRRPNPGAVVLNGARPVRALVLWEKRQLKWQSEWGNSCTTCGKV